MINILFTLTVLIFCSCETKNNPVPKNTVPKYPIIGKWSLVETMGGFSRPEHYKEGSIIWNFDTKNRVHVEMKIELPENTSVPLRKAGVFHIEHKPDTTNLMNGEMIIGDWPKWCEYRITAQKNEFVLDCDEASCGMAYTFKRAD